MKHIKNILKVFFVVIVFGFSLVLAIDLFVVNGTDVKVVLNYDAANLRDVDCVLVLGAGLKDGGPSDMLRERLDTAISLYNDNNDLVLLMSGDHLRKDYDEVNVMKRYAVLNGVPSEKIFMDHAGISTYDSIKRAKDIFGVKKIVVVTQKYHLYRALFIAKSLGIEAYGVDATKKIYPGQKSRDFREILARNKDFVKSLLEPDAKLMGSKISLDGDGNKTNDKYVIITDSYTGVEVFSGSSTVVHDVLELVNRNDYKEQTCDGIPGYHMNVNGNKYMIEVYDAVIHIGLNGKELELDKKEAEVIMNLLNLH